MEDYRQRLMVALAPDKYAMSIGATGTHDSNIENANILKNNANTQCSNETDTYDHKSEIAVSNSELFHVKSLFQICLIILCL